MIKESHDLDDKLSFDIIIPGKKAVHNGGGKRNFFVATFHFGRGIKLGQTISKLWIVSVLTYGFVYSGYVCTLDYSYYCEFTYQRTQISNSKFYRKAKNQCASAGSTANSPVPYTKRRDLLSSQLLRLLYRKQLFMLWLRR